MTFARYFCLLAVSFNGIAGQTCSFKWVPSADMEDHDVDPGGILGGISSFTKPVNDSNVQGRVSLYYFSRDNPGEAIVLKPGEISDIVKSNIKKPFKLIIHGYLHSANNEMVVDLRKQLLKFHDVNVIEVDWSSVSREAWYFAVAEQTGVIGRYVAKLLDFLISEGADPRSIHIMGHSLGAHVAGYAGTYLKSGKIGRITGLDPALPAFKNNDITNRLDTSDAEFVDCIHTCGGGLGFMEPICHADFYPNGGRNFQPGCVITDVFGVCSHLRSTTYFKESIDPQYVFQVGQCPAIPGENPVDCPSSPNKMGYFLEPRTRGIFYGVTGFRPPFSITPKQNCKLQDNASSGYEQY